MLFTTRVERNILRRAVDSSRAVVNEIKTELMHLLNFIGFIRDVTVSNTTNDIAFDSIALKLRSRLIPKT